VTGTTVLGLKYKDGVMIACDTLGASRDETRSRPRSRSENHSLDVCSACAWKDNPKREAPEDAFFFFARVPRRRLAAAVRENAVIDTKPNRDVARVC